MRTIMRDKLSESTEDYLKTIYELTVFGERASTNQIAERMGVTPASVTGMLKRLATSEPPLLEYHKHRGAALTSEGEKIALEIIRHHRLLESYLHDVLGYSWDMVHAEADRLEHVISEDFEERISLALGDPSNDPHGDPIPTRDLDIPEQLSVSLRDLRPGQRATVLRVENNDPDLLRHLSALGLTPQAHLRVVAHSQFDDNLSLEIGGEGSPIVLGPSVTDQIYVEVA